MTSLNEIPGHELGPIRPPSEAGSLLIRLTRNCPWNRCAFCHTYRGRKYSQRKAEEVIEDVRNAGRIAEGLLALSRSLLEGGKLGQETQQRLRFDPSLSDAHWNVANFLFNGGKTVFLQDADPLAGSPLETERVLQAIRDVFPAVSRITTYCRSRTAARIGAEGFLRFRQAGLNRVHIGMESGSDAVLERIAKGVKADDHVKGGRAVKEGGLELSEYVMPGVGGAKLSGAHARESAHAINRIGPDFVRLRTLAVVGSADLHEPVQKGEFLLLGDDGIVEEIKSFVEGIEVSLRLESDHILNLLEEVCGNLPEDKPEMIALLEGYLSLPDRERINFRIGRRMGIYRHLSDLHGPLRARVDKEVNRLRITTPAQADEAVQEMLTRFV